MPKENSIAIFSRRWRGDTRCPTSMFWGANTKEHKMKQVLKMTTAPAAALLALAFVAMTTPASANPNEFCRQDVTSGMRSCSFATLEQCKAMSSGRGGDCYRDPFLADTNAFAYQPKTSHAKNGIHPAKNPVENR
jgi:hypothetical protein